MTWHLKTNTRRLDPKNIMSYITIMVSSYFLSNAVPSFTPIFIYMAIVGALVLAAQILDLRKKMKKIEGPFLGPHLGGQEYEPETICHRQRPANKF
jgi:hypothetical protein